MGPDRSLGGVVLNPPRVLQSGAEVSTHRLNAETSTRGGEDPESGSLPLADNAIIPRPARLNASPESLHAPASTATALSSDVPASKTLPHHVSFCESNGRSIPSHSQANQSSHDTAMTGSSGQIYTPPESDTSTGAPGTSEQGPVPSSQDSQLYQLSELAAAQDRMTTDSWNSRKRTVNGAVKPQMEDTSSSKGHIRNTSTASRTSATGSNIGELSSELRTRLSYAMIKVNKGWQSHSLEEVESLASQAASPTSSTSTIHRPKDSSASPQISITTIAQTPSQKPITQRRKSNTPPEPVTNKSVLAPPAPIQPSSSMLHPRRNSNPRYHPASLPNTNLAPPYTHRQRTSLQSGHLRPRGAESTVYSPHQNVREQDAIETLLFMSSPGNSANLKHAFTPNGSPRPEAAGEQMIPPRHALPSGPRKTLPTQRPAFTSKKVEFEKSPGMAPVPGSPMDLDSPQRQHSAQYRGTVSGRHVKNYFRGALSMPSGIGTGNATLRKVLCEEDIDRMLDQAGAAADSSDDEEIQLPPKRSSVAGVMHG